MEELDAETPDDHRMLDDLEQDLEKLDQLMLEHRISKEETHDFVVQGRKSIRLSQAEASKGEQQEEEKKGVSAQAFKVTGEHQEPNQYLKNDHNLFEERKSEGHHQTPRDDNENMFQVYSDSMNDDLVAYVEEMIEMINTEDER